jgi:CBS-domain-containing membrane protein
MFKTILLAVDASTGAEKAAELASKLAVASGDEAELHKAAGLTAAELMTSPAVMVSPDVTLAEAARLATRAGVRRLPVVDGQGRLVGIVSRVDLLKVFLRPDHEIHREIVEELIGSYTWPDPRAVTVEVTKGAVALYGRLPRRSQIDTLVRLVQSVDGVVRVDAQLRYEVDDMTPLPAPVMPLRY